MYVTLTVTEGPHQGRTYKFTEHDTFIVGRASYAHFRLPAKDKFFSRAHFMVEVNPPLCRLMDMASTNGTYVNDEKVAEADLKHTDLIQGGQTVICVEIVESPETSDDVDSPAEPEPAGVSQPEDDELVLESADETGGDVPPTQEIPTAPPPLPNPSPAAPPELGSMESTIVTNRDGTEKIGTLAHFDLIRELGRGGMGIVYLAKNQRDDHEVALKTVKPKGPASSRDIDRFLREASILRDLTHPNIVSFFELGEADGELFFSMEYVPGVDAAKLMKSSGPLPIGRAVALACQLLNALEYAHGRQFVHRDIKPANLLIVEEPQGDGLKLADFGLARVYRATKMSGLTLQGEMGGSLAYIAPEQITNYRESKPAADLYSVAATLYMLLTGKYIFDFPSALNERVLTILQSPCIQISKRRADIPSGLADAIHKALSKQAEGRFQDAVSMRKALQPFSKLR